MPLYIGHTVYQAKDRRVLGRHAADTAAEHRGRRDRFAVRQQSPRPVSAGPIQGKFGRALPGLLGGVPRVMTFPSPACFIMMFQPPSRNMQMKQFASGIGWCLAGACD